MASLQRVGPRKFVVKIKGIPKHGSAPSPSPGPPAPDGTPSPPLTAREQLLRAAEVFAYYGVMGLPGSLMLSPLREVEHEDIFGAPVSAEQQPQQQQLEGRPASSLAAAAPVSRKREARGEPSDSQQQHDATMQEEDEQAVSVEGVSLAASLEEEPVAAGRGAKRRKAAPAAPKPPVAKSKAKRASSNGAGTGAAAAPARQQRGRTAQAKEQRGSKTGSLQGKAQHLQQEQVKQQQEQAKQQPNQQQQTQQQKQEEHVVAQSSQRQQAEQHQERQEQERQQKEEEKRQPRQQQSKHVAPEVKAPAPPGKSKEAAKKPQQLPSNPSPKGPGPRSPPETEAAASPPALPPAQAAAAGDEGRLVPPGLFADISPPGAPAAAAAALVGLQMPCGIGGDANVGDGGDSQQRPAVPSREALDYLLAEAKNYKHSGDGRFNTLGRVWDVYGLAQYALAVVGYLEYVDALQRAAQAAARDGGAGAAQHALLGEAHDPSSGRTAMLLADTAKLAGVGAQYCSVARGPDLAKQALVMLLERLQAICHMRHLATVHERLAGAAARLRASGCIAGAHHGRGAQGPVLPAAGLAAPRAAAGHPALKVAGSRGVGGNGGPCSKASDDSNASCQTPSSAAVAAAAAAAAPAAVAAAANGGGGGHGNWHGHGHGGGAHHGAVPGSAAVAAAARAADEARHAERMLLRGVDTMLRMTEAMHQAVMRLQQFMECPEVQASVPARQAGVHMAALGVDGGMYSVPQLAAHARDTVTCIMKLLRSAKR